MECYTIGIRALVGAISREELVSALVGVISREELVSELGCNVWVCLEEAMVGSHVEGVSEQDRGVETLAVLHWVGRTYVISSFEGRIAKLKLGGRTPWGMWTFRAID